jgi:thioredoxin-like negative regulator of GroEL
MEHLSKSTLLQFLARRPHAIIHVDGKWDPCRKLLADRIHKLEPQFEDRVAFGYVDCDAEPGYSTEIRLVNVPSVAYYNGPQLVGVVIGVNQDVSGNIERLIRGDAVDQSHSGFIQ